QVFEVEQQAGLVEFAAFQQHSHAIVVPVRLLALSAIVSQVVTGGEGVFYGDLKHCASGGARCAASAGCPNIAFYRGGAAMCVHSVGQAARMLSSTTCASAPAQRYPRQPGGPGGIAGRGAEA